MKKQKNTVEKKLNAILDIAQKEADSLPFPEEDKISKVEVKNAIVESKQTYTPTGNTESDDIAYARSRLYQLIEKASDSIDSMIGVTEETGHPRSYEVLGQLLKITGDLTKDLVGLHKTKAEINKFKLPGESDIPKSITDGNPGGNTFIFEGTTSELLDLIKDSKKEE